jgi:cytochrome c556
MDFARRGLACALAAGLACVATAAVGQGAPAAAIAQRQASFKAMGTAFKTVNDQMKTGQPDLAAIRTAAARIKQHGDAQFAFFPKGSGPEAGVKTAAKPAIWSDAAGFAAAQKSMQAEANKLQALAAGSDVAAIRAQVTVVGRVCGGCHRKYRVED